MSMNITINGENKVIKASNFQELLQELEIDPRKIAIERNLQLVKRTEFEVTTINEGDEIEIINFVGGG